MTEAEWLASKSPRDLAAFARGKVEPARFRWLAAEWGVRIRRHFDPDDAQWFDAYVAWAGGAGPHPDEAVPQSLYRPLVSGHTAYTVALHFIEFLQLGEPLLALPCAIETASFPPRLVPAPDPAKSHRGRSAAARRAEREAVEAARATYDAARSDLTAQVRREFCDQFRCAAGNPFRPTVWDAAWRTSDVLGLARSAFDAADFRLLPILADALEEAGCDCAGVLGHLRGGGVHVRGCWVLEWARDER